jgi:hypothetical protein
VRSLQRQPAGNEQRHRHRVRDAPVTGTGRDRIAHADRGRTTMPAGDSQRSRSATDAVLKRLVGRIVLGLSACGYPLTHLVIRRWGRRGAAVVESVCIGLAIRDASMVGSGVPQRLRRLPAVLLRLELAVGVVASLAGMPPLLTARSTDCAPSARIRAAELARRAAVAGLFAIHTVRFGIYLRPDRGRRATAWSSRHWPRSG